MEDHGTNKGRTNQMLDTSHITPYKFVGHQLHIA